MATMTRQQRRLNQRKLAKTKDIQAAIEKLDTNAEKFAKAAFESFRAEEVPKIEGAAISKMLLWNMAFLRIKHGYGRKRMLQYVADLAEFCSDMAYDEVTMPQLIEMLDDELKIDTETELRKIQRRAQQSLNNRAVNVIKGDK